jgi:hypothetical protein
VEKSIQAKRQQKIYKEGNSSDRFSFHVLIAFTGKMTGLSDVSLAPTPVIKYQHSANFSLYSAWHND